MDRRIAARTMAAALLGVGLLLAGTVPATAVAPAPDVPLPAASASDVGPVLRDTLGESFAGAWLDPATGVLTVGTTDADDAALIEAAGAQADLLPNSLDLLDSVMSELDARSASVPDAVTGWFVDPASNAVVVRATDPAAAEAFAGDLDAVLVEEVEVAPRPLADLVGGEVITAPDGSRCSIGFSATSGGVGYVITAGHCTRIGGTWAGRDGTPIGPVESSSYPGDDFGLIRVDSQAWSVSPFVARDGGRIAVTGASPAPVGSTVCKSGAVSGFTCGTLEATDQTVNYGNGDVVFGLIRTNLCAEPGDSGGPLLAGTQAQGILSGGTSCFLILRGETYFQPIGEVLSATGVDLVTAG